MSAPIPNDTLPTARTTLTDLPSEILLQILTPFALPSLLPLTQTCKRLAALVLRIYHARLVTAAALTPRQLILECYHPSLRLTEEALHCAPLGTPGLAASAALDEHRDESVPERLRRYASLTSRFRPYRLSARPRRSPWYRHPAGDVPGSRTYVAPAPAGAGSSTTGEQRPDRTSSLLPGAPLSADEVAHLPLPRQIVGLDGHEAFTQLKAVTTLVQEHPATGAFGSSTDVSDGVLRLFRAWLAGESARAGSGSAKPLNPEPEHAGVSAPQKQRHDQDSSILWVNDGERVGVRSGVQERKLRRDQGPILMRADEDDAASYSIELQEVLVRTRHLVCVTERSLEVQRSIGENKAIVIGSW